MPSEHTAETIRRPIERDVGVAAMVAALFGLALAIGDAIPNPTALIDRQATIEIMSVEPAAAPPLPPLPVTPQLLGLRADRLPFMLGEADFSRAEGAAEMRRYSGADCTLVVFLYRSAAGLVVEHAESRPTAVAAGPIAVSACFDGLTRQRRTAAATATPSPEAAAPRSLVR